MDTNILANIQNMGMGFANSNYETMEMLQKALEASSGVDPSGFGSGRALIPESLEQTLVNILHTSDEAVLFQALKKQPVRSPVHQWNLRDEVGAEDGAWVAEGGSSQETDQTIARVYTTMKYLQTLRKVTLQMASSNAIEDAMALEQNAGTLWLVRAIEKALFTGNSDLVTEQPDGIDKIINETDYPDNVLDLRGADASSATMEDKINEACRVIREKFGRASLMLGSTFMMQDLQALLRDRIRFEAGQTMGTAVLSKYPTPFGTPDIKENIFINEKTAPSASAISGKPDAVTIDGGPTIAADAVLSKFVAADAGNYYYKFAGINKYGEGVISAESTVAANVAASKCTFTIGPGSTVPTAIRVFRTKKGAGSGSTVLAMFDVKYDGDPTTIVDRNWYLPGTSTGYVFTMGAIYDAIAWLQWLPMMKFDLFPTNAAVYPFLMLLFGALQLKKPPEHARILNISPSNLGWF